MRVRRLFPISLPLAICAVMLLPAAGLAQAAPKPIDDPRPELALDFTYLRSNAPPGGCTCFSLEGGSATFALPLGKGPFSAVVDVTAGHGSGISSSNLGLNLSAYTVGARYSPRLNWSKVHVFGQILVGVAHSSGSLVQGGTTSVSNSGAAFAANAGGGVDLSVSRHFRLRLFEADYLATTFDNGSNNHQNNLRVSAGAVLRF